MKKSKLILATMAAAMLSSCAYMQTNKNIRELGATYHGTELKPETLSLHRKGSQWYLGSPSGEYSKRYPAIHDEVFFKDDNSPTYTLKQTDGGRLYYPISTGTATCLQRTDGYAQTDALATEIQRLGGTPQSTLPKATAHTIRAEVVPGQRSSMLPGKRSPQEPGMPARILAGLDTCTVDALGTAVYNVAIPIMAPFVFFYEFLSED